MSVQESPSHETQSLMERLEEMVSSIDGMLPRYSVEVQSERPTLTPEQFDSLISSW